MTSPCRLHGDCWNGVHTDDWDLEEASASAFETVLRRLDGARYTLITIARDDAHLTIGGGAGRYVVHATFDDQTFWNLVRPEPATGVIRLTAGGQEGYFPAAQVVGLEQARSAGLAFLTSGTLDPAQRSGSQ